MCQIRGGHNVIINPDDGEDEILDPENGLDDQGE